MRFLILRSITWGRAWRITSRRAARAATSFARLPCGDWGSGSFCCTMAATTNLVTAIDAHEGNGSEANAVEGNFDKPDHNAAAADIGFSALALVALRHSSGETPTCLASFSKLERHTGQFSGPRADHCPGLKGRICTLDCCVSRSLSPCQ